MRCSLAALVVISCFAACGSVRADEKSGRLDIYFIDVEGGASTLFVTPKGESLLIDSGYPGNQNRDLNRILHVVRDVAGRTAIDHAVVTHWHLDHFGNHAALAGQIPIKHFWDRGIPDALEEDPGYGDRIAGYRAATQNASGTLKAGQQFDLPSDKTPLTVKVLTASREVVPNAGEPNPFAADNKPRPEDSSDNASSLSLLFGFGEFRFLCCGDLTWNVEAELVTPKNPVGMVDLFMVTHHGLNQSNNPTLVHAIDPVVAVMCNGPTKGGDPETIATLRSGKSLKALYQLHRNVRLDAGGQAPADYIANSEPTENCSGRWVMASVAADGASYTVQIDTDGRKDEYETRSR